MVPAGILFIDITDPARPAPAGTIRDGEGGFDVGATIGGMAVLEPPGGRVHLAVTGSGGLVMLLDVTDPARPAPAGAIRDGEGGFDSIGGAGMAVPGPPGDGRLYLATVGGQGIRLADVTDPARPAPAGAVPDIPGSFYATGGAEYATAFYLAGRTYALGTGGDGVHILDVTDPARPAPAGSAWDGRGGFDVLDGASRTAVVESPGGPFLALVAGDEGIQILDVVNPARPVPAGAIRYGEGGLDPQWVTDMAAYRSPGGRDYLLVADHYAGIYVVDIADPFRPVLAGGAGGWEGGAVPAGEGGGHRGGCLGEDYPDRIDGVHGVEVYVAGDGRNYALVSCDRGIRILDMSDPAAPIPAGSLLDGMNNHTFGAIYWTALYEPPGGGTYALLADYMSGIHIVNVTDPHRPVPAGSMPEETFDPIPGTPIMVVASGDRVLALASGVGGIHLLDVTNPHRPAHAGFLPAAGLGLPPDHIYWYVTLFESGGGETYALVDGGKGALVLKMPRPHAPVMGGGTAQVVARGGGAPAPGGGVPALALVGAGDGIMVGGPGAVTEFGPVLPRDGGDGIVGVVDLADPRSPRIIGTLPPAYGRTGEVEVVYSPEGRAYGTVIGPAGGLMVAGVADPHAAAAHIAIHDLGLDPDSPVEIFRPHDGRAYMMAGSGDGIRIIDVTYPDSPVPVGRIQDNLGGFYYLDDIRDISVFESGDGLVYALIGSGDGIQVMDVTNPYRPSPAGGMRELPGSPVSDGVRRIDTVGTSGGSVLALAAGGAGHAAILDITNPHNPVPVWTARAGIAGHEHAAASAPVADGRIPVGGDSGHVPDVAAFETSDGGLRALITGHAGFIVLDITDPAAPVQVAAIEGMEAPDIVSVFESSDGRLHVVLAGDGGIWVSEVDDLTWIRDAVWP